MRFVYVSVILMFGAFIMFSIRLASAEASSVAGTWRGDSEIRSARQKLQHAMTSE